METPNLEEMLKAAATAVFPTMLSLKVAFVPPPDAIPGESFVAGTIGFAGAFNAVLYMSMTSAFARSITGKMLGLDDSMLDGDEMIGDVVGELTNMHAGHIKTRLCDRGIACSMTIPSVIRGKDFKIQPLRGFQKQEICACSGSDLVKLAFLIKQG